MWAGKKRVPALPSCFLVGNGGGTTAQFQRSFDSLIWESRAQRLKRGDRLEQAYSNKLIEMREEKQRGIVWRLASGVVCERAPIIFPEPHQWEDEVADRAFEKKRLLARDPEKNLEMMQEWKLGAKKVTRKEKKAQKKQQNKPKQAGEGGGEGEADEPERQPDDEDAPTQKEAVGHRRMTLEEVKALIEELSPRITEADHANNRKSLERRLAETYN